MSRKRSHRRKVNALHPPRDCVMVITDQPGVQLWSGALFRMGRSTPYSATAFALQTSASLSEISAAVRAIVGRGTTVSVHRVIDSRITLGLEDASGLLEAAKKSGTLDSAGHLRFRA